MKNKFFGWQTLALKMIRDENNVILCSPTGSGKTLVFLEWARKKGLRIVITAPIKALSNQRYRQQLELLGAYIAIETGDIKKVPEDWQILCCTQEIYTAKYMDLEDVTLIVDEMHYIFENADRSRTYIDALMYSKAKNILVCSATLGNVRKFKTYIEKVSRRNFFLYENTQRITKLQYQGYLSPKTAKNALVIVFSRRGCDDILCSIIKNRKQIKDSRKLATIRKYANELEISGVILKQVRYGVAAYYGSLLPKEKFFIEKLFESKVVDTVVGTDALALGVNFPVEHVIFCQLVKYYEGRISRNLFEQISGRAGRKGYFDIGYVHYCDDYRVESRNYNTRQEYQTLLQEKNEEVKIDLQPNISNILQGKSSIDEEAFIIKNYSTEEKDLEELKENMTNIVHFIGNFSRDRDFIENIGNAYFDEYSPDVNCKLFMDILREAKIDKLVSKYCECFQDLLQLRKYLKRLPKKFRKSSDIYALETHINSIDSTALNV